MKRILLIATGGTIASTPSDNGLEPSVDVEKLLSYIPSVRSFCHLEGISIMEIDSSNINPSHMEKIAKTIESYYDAFDGFVISHGTDTMAYSAAALSYMLKNLTKPVVFTGSQLPIENAKTDAKKNLTDAIAFACEKIRGVYLVFHGIAILGTHAMKTKSRNFDAFQSLNLPPIAEIDSYDIRYEPSLPFSVCKEIFQTATTHKKTFFADTALCNNLFVLKIFPGMKPDIFDFIKTTYKGVIIESFGLGGIPEKDPDLHSKIHELIESNLCVVITTQCLWDGIDLNVYKVGHTLAKQKVILSGNLTTEALVMKLMWALAHFEDPSDIKTFIETPYFFDHL